MKLVFIFFLLIDDGLRLVRYITHKTFYLPQAAANGLTMSRSDFIVKAGLAASSLPLAGFTWGIVRGAHDYRIHTENIVLKNLPSVFDGLRIVQISDIHCGSFFDKNAVKKGIDMILEQKADLIFFTGDLVNNITDEAYEYAEMFSMLKAPLGVYSVLGNHDYGDYHQWSSQQEKRRNFENMINLHKAMGWHLLMNECVIIERQGSRLAIIGVENWSARGNFPKYGKIELAVKGTEGIPVKLLLSHDPSHWDAQVRQEYPDIDVMFSGHTHGMQFGLEIGNIRWSPAQYFYKQWAGLYKEANQYLYVNRGFGFIGFPGRLGILPEITVVRLTS